MRRVAPPDEFDPHTFPFDMNTELSGFTLIGYKEKGTRHIHHTVPKWHGRRGPQSLPSYWLASIPSRVPIAYRAGPDMVWTRITEF